MKKISKLVSILCIFSILCSTFSLFSVYADTEKCTISVTSSDSARKAGDIISADISIKNNTGISSFTLKLLYDNSIFEAVTVDKVANSFDYNIINDKSYIKLGLANMGNWTGNGNMFTIKFKLLKDVTTDTELTLSYNKGDICDWNLNDVDININNCTISSITQLPSIKSNVQSGTVEKGTKIELTNSISGAEIYYTTDGSEPTKASIKYTAPIEINETVTIKARAYKDGYTASEIFEQQYTIINTGIGELPNIESSIKTSIIKKGTKLELINSIIGAEIYYTTDGSEPTKTSIKYTAPIEINETITIKARAYKDGYTASEIFEQLYTVVGEIIAKPSSNYVNAGEEVDITYSVNNCMELASFTAELDYNNNELELINITQSSDLLGNFVDNTNRVTWVYAAGVSGANVELFTVRFKVKDNTELKTIFVEFNFDGDAVNADKVKLNLLTDNSKAEFNVVMAGDVQSDNKIDTYDSLKLAQYLAKYTNIKMSEKELKAADIYLDGKINIKDLLQLMKRIVSTSSLQSSDPIKADIETKPEFTMVTKELDDNKIAVTMSIKNNCGIGGFEFQLDFDKKVLTPISYSESSILGKGSITTNMNDKNAELNSLEYVTMVWGAIDNITSDGELFTLIFNKKSNTPTKITVNKNYSIAKNIEDDKCIDIESFLQNTLFINQDSKIENVIDKEKTSIKIDGNSITGNIYTNVNISDITQKKTVSVIVAVYNSNNEMIKVAGKENVSLNLGENTINFKDISIDNIRTNNENYKYKVFVWDISENIFKPVTVVAENKI